MNEIKKAERVRVLGVRVNPLRIDRAMHLTSRYLEKHKFEYIVFANTPAAIAGKDEAFFEDYIENAALVLPGDSNIEEAVEVKRWMEEGLSYQAEYFRRLFTRLNKHRASVYMMVEKEDQLRKIRNIVHEKYNKLCVEDILWEADSSVNRMVNGINSLAPDILFICGTHERMSRFLAEHACKINAGLCFCMEEVMTDTKTDISDWLIGSRLQKKYKELAGKTSRFLHDIVFKKQMKQHQQKEEMTVETNEEES